VQRVGSDRPGGGAENRPSLAHNTWSVPRDSVSLSTSDRKSPWLFAPPEVVSILRRMIDGHPRIGDVYSMNTGIKTDDNRDYYLKSVEELEGNRAWVTTLGSERVLVESSLLFPVVFGKKVDVWSTEYSWMILPHRSTDWKPYPELQFERDFPEAYAHFHRHRTTLVKRQDYVSTGSKGPFYMIFRLSPSKMGHYNVTFPLIETHLKAALVPPRVVLAPFADERPVIVDQSVRILDVRPSGAALYVSGLLNCRCNGPLAFFLADPKEAVRSKQYPQWTVAVLPLVPWRSGEQIPQAISTLVKEGPASSTAVSPAFQSELDHLVGELFGLTQREVEVIDRFLRFAMGDETRWVTSKP